MAEATKGATLADALPVQTEREFQDAVVQLAQLCGWWIYHTHDSRRSAPGFPDLVLAKQGRVVFAELKSQRGRVSEPQRAWLDALAPRVGQPASHAAYVWRAGNERDWRELERVLTGDGP